jgi:beta-glucosidase/6-phospho-beta-glucosidase/beta-galactosidase
MRAMRAPYIVPLLLLSCAGDPQASFPGGFLWGVATAGFQNDPGCPTVPAAECTDRHSDWYDYVTSKEIQADRGTHVTGEPLENGPGSYELYPVDLDLITDKLRGNALRLSIEWSRLFPRSTVGAEGHEALRAVADPRAVAHYHALFSALRRKGVRPLVTLHHYTLPSWIHDAVGCHQDLDRCTRRGWLDRDGTVREIAKYAGFAAREYGAEVDLWATLNEPFAVVVPGFLLPSPDRTNPPALPFRFKEARAATVAMIEAHARMYDAVRRNDQADTDGDGQPAQVGLVYNMTPAAPRNPDDPLDVRGARDMFYLYNEVFLNGAIKGDLDEKMDRTTVHRPDLAGRMDFLGINYYTRVVVEGLPEPALPQLSPLTTFNALTLSLWNEYPRGIYEMALRARDYGLPVYITENGTADQSDEGVAPRFLVQHLSWLSRAPAEGVQLRGYFYWRLVDNYEWNHGMAMKFGLFRLGPQKERTPRPVAAVYRQIAEQSAVPAELIGRYPLPE